MAIGPHTTRETSFTFPRGSEKRYQFQPGDWLETRDWLGSIARRLFISFTVWLTMISMALAQLPASSGIPNGAEVATAIEPPEGLSPKPDDHQQEQKGDRVENRRAEKESSTEDVSTANSDSSGRNGSGSGKETSLLISDRQVINGRASGLYRLFVKRAAIFSLLRACSAPAR